MSYPIVFIQQNDADYLIYALAQAKASNPNSEIYLIGDDKNKVYDFITHLAIDDFSSRSNQFAQYYKHMSPNKKEFELICIQRWFILQEFMKKLGYTKALHLDTDVMLYQDVSKEEAFIDYDWALSGDYNEGLFACGHICFINNLEVLSAFCDFTLEYYKNKLKLEEIENLYSYLLENKISSAISDMVFLKKFILEKNYKTAQVSKIIDGFMYDNNLNSADDFEPNGNTKYIELKNKKPYGIHLPTQNEVYFKALHFQGATKCLMRKNYTGSKLKLAYYKFLRMLKKTGK